MRTGAIFPTTEIGGDQAAIREWAEAVEELGFDHITVLEHVLGFRDDPEQTAGGLATPDRCWDEPMVLFGFLAGITRRVELVTSVLVAPMRQTVLLAKQAAEVDVLSSGRLRLGLGVGGSRRESEALHEDYGTRGRRIEEQVALLRALWIEEVVTFDGRWHQLDGAGLAPHPVQRPIPVWLGGMAERSIERAARIADGWMPLPMEPDDEAVAMVRTFREHAERFGRAPDSLGLEAYLPTSWITPDHWHEHVDGWRALGATHLTVGTGNAGRASASDHIAALRRVKTFLDG